jgi:hypothetical protein
MLIYECPVSRIYVLFDTQGKVIGKHYRSYTGETFVNCKFVEN